MWLRLTRFHGTLTGVHVLGHGLLGGGKLLVGQGRAACQGVAKERVVQGRGEAVRALAVGGGFHPREDLGVVGLERVAYVLGGGVLGFAAVDLCLRDVLAAIALLTGRKHDGDKAGNAGYGGA